MTKYKVVLVPFPFDDLSGSKVRPAVCLCNPIEPYRHVILAFITSRITANPSETDLVVKSDGPEFSATGLNTSSTLHLHRLMTVRTTMIRRELGQLPQQMQVEVDKRLKKLFEL